jgi:hypothetical protein
MDERGIVLRTVDEERASLISSDGRLRLRLKADTFDASHQVMIQSLGADARVDTPIGEVISGPYAITISPDDRWRRDAVLTFRLPSSEIPEDVPDEWIGSLAVIEFEPGSGDWHEHRSTGRADPAFVSTRIDHQGVYAMVRRFG